jgi:hypothetical protein
MKRLIIDWLYDTHECDTCGATYADGARVTLNDSVILELIPVAHCTGGKTWFNDDVYKLIFEALGYEIKEAENE